MPRKCKKGWVFNKKKDKCVRGVDLLAIAKKTSMWDRTKNLRKKLKKAGISGLE